MMASTTKSGRLGWQGRRRRRRRRSRRRENDNGNFSIMKTLSTTFWDLG